MKFSEAALEYVRRLPLPFKAIVTIMKPANSPGFFFKILVFKTLALTVILSVLPLKAQTDKQVYDAVVKKYGNMQTVSVEFTSAMYSGAKGVLKAKRGNKYVMDFAGMTIASDGKTVWNYQKKKATVVLNDYQDSEGIPVEKVFFTFLQSYQPTLIKDPNNKNLLSLKLEPKAGQKPINGVSSLVLQLKPKTYEITGIMMNTEGGQQNITIKRITPNAKLTDADFTFQPPQGTKVVDLR
ncbi:MAG TPA: outer membrane lipoprotein carrier protein LolA [Patescibacteria group bacterium]|nr:outer membrane lipoprotein carrier protein LolA [Patescibacteria group bacterium]